MSGIDDADQRRRNFKAPYTPKNPIPTIRQFREEQKERQAQAEGSEDGDNGRTTGERAQDVYHRWKDGETADSGSVNAFQVNEVSNAGKDPDRDELRDVTDDLDEEEAAKKGMEDTSEVPGANQDPKQRRKAFKKRGGEGAEREVTDPVTHLPVVIHDFTNKNLKQSPENLEPPSRKCTGLDDKDQQIRDADTQRRAHEELQGLFPPPDIEAVGAHLAKIQGRGITVGLFVISLIMLALLATRELVDFSMPEEGARSGRGPAGVTTFFPLLFLAVGSSLGGAIAIYLVRHWTEKKVQDIWERHVWEAERRQGRKRAQEDTPESTQWLSELLSSIWPLVNPDLFTSLADSLEDVMQASLPKLVRMVSVEDIGQGSESIRILGIKWLPTGAAGKSVSADGKIQSVQNHDSSKSDRTESGEGEVQDCEQDHASEKKTTTSDSNETLQERENISGGMEAEEGDFVNLEIAFSYRARADGKSIRSRAKNAHLYLAFYLPSNIKFPVWVELQGFVGVVRLRLQLTPDPPFFSLCTLTFLGQPKVDAACIPLTRRGLNIMDVPIISNFVQSAIDAALAEYVAPKSLTLDLKDMLVGDDFKKDTASRGVLVVRIKRAYDFKEGDAGFGPIVSGSADAYVSAGWAKFGKPVWSTRVIESDMHPSWDETGFLLVTEEELNVNERLRLQLWDSDRMTADDDLGRIEVELKSLMKDPKSNGRMWDRQDGFRALKAGEAMPGKLEWSVGYFSKTRIQEEQLVAANDDPEVKTIADLKKKVNEQSERKLREAKKDETRELEQQKAQDFKEREDALIIASTPPQKYPSGILSIVIHQITGLELEAINKRQAAKHETESDEQEEGEDLPSAYCNIILNHQKIFKTRTKPKNGKPFFNAGCERFVRDWRTAEVIVSVRDARVHEDDALLGIVILPLAEIFEERSQINDVFPLLGGIGFGKCRISMVFRSVQLQAPRELLGWDYGTLDIKSEVKVTCGDGSLDGLRVRGRTSLSKGKWYAGEDGICKTKSGKSVRLAVKKRYSSPLVFEFRSYAALKDKSAAFAVLWLKDIPDGEEKILKISVWKGDLKRAEANVLEEYGEKVGELEFTAKFWHGLSGYHSSLARKDPNLANVMECLDCAQDSKSSGTSDQSASASSSDQSSSGETLEDSAGDDSDGPERRRGLFTKAKTASDLSSDGKRGTVDQLHDYKQHSKQLHRRNRGLMQWKGPRTLKWVGGKFARVGQKVEGMFEHSQRSDEVQTEV